MNVDAESGETDVVTRLEVERTGPGSYRLDWRNAFGELPVTVRVADHPGALATAVPVCHAQVGSAAVTGLDDRRRYYFALTPGDAPALIVAQRDVPFAGCVNFRDLGGYRTEDGRRVRWGALFRSGHMARLTAGDLALFATLGIRTICDFRVQEELLNEAAALPGAPRQEILGIAPGIGDRQYFHRIFASSADPVRVLDAMHAVMRSFIIDAVDKYRRMFALLLEADSGSALLNCSAGKERTGIGSALLLSALGVPRATVVYDFLLSRRYFPAETEIPRVREKYGVTLDGEAGRALIMPLLETRESYLQSAFAAVDHDYGSVSGFLAERCGLGPAEIETLRERYTEPQAGG